MENFSNLDGKDCTLGHFMPLHLSLPSHYHFIQNFNANIALLSLSFFLMS